MTTKQIAYALLFGVIFLIVSLVLDYQFFTVSVPKTVIQSLLATAIWGFCMKRWYWNKA